MLSFLILLLLLTAFLLRVDFIFYIAYVCMGLYAWSRWYPPRALSQVQIERTFPKRAFLNETVPVVLKLYNRSRLPLTWAQLYESVAVVLRSGYPLHQVITLRGRETAEFTYHLQANRRGYYQVGPLQLQTGDLFGFFPIHSGKFSADYLTVYPRMTPLTQLGLPSRLPFGTIASQQRLFVDPARPMGVRDFRSGDSLRQIHWKVSGHTNRLMVKTFQPAISLETAVLLNLHREDYHRTNRSAATEWAIEVAASLAAHLTDRRQAVGLITNGIDPLLAGHQFDAESGRLSHTIPVSPLHCIPAPITPRPGRPHLMKILETLARLESEDTIPLTTWLTEACLPLNWGVTLLILTAQGDETVCGNCYRLLQAGFNPILMAVEPDYNFAQVQKRARLLGFVAYNVTQSKDLDRWKRPYDSFTPHFAQ